MVKVTLSSKGISSIAHFLQNSPFKIGQEKIGKYSKVGKNDIEKRKATHSTSLAWRIPRTEETDKLLSTGSQRV